MVGRDVVACFIHSSTSKSKKKLLSHELAKHQDMVLVDAPETSKLIKTNTKYSKGKKQGRGMPTFKQYAFFRFAARVWSEAAYVGKVDDDTIPNLRVLVPLLWDLRCASGSSVPPGSDGPPRWDNNGDRRPNLPRVGPPSDNAWSFIGAMNWAAPVPKAYDFGIRMDRCGFGWNLESSLTNFGTSFGEPASPSYVQACDTRGGVLPLPYATGAGYIFSAELLKWVGTSKNVSAWVAEAGGPTREDLQWQKYEDTSTGYWLSYAPERILYVDIGPLIHDAACHIDGSVKRDEGALQRPVSNHTLFAHNLKHADAFSWAWNQLQGDEVPYDHGECVHKVYGQRRPSRDQVQDEQREYRLRKHKLKKKKKLRKFPRRQAP